MPKLDWYKWEFHVNAMAGDVTVHEMGISKTSERALSGDRFTNDRFTNDRVTGDRVTGDRSANGALSGGWLSGRSLALPPVNFSGHWQYLFDIVLCCVVFSFSALAMIAIAVTAPVLVAVSALAGLLGQKPKFRWQSTTQA